MFKTFATFHDIGIAFQFIFFDEFSTGMRGFPGNSAVKNLPAVQEMWARSLGQKDPLEKGMASHSSILAWETPRTEEPGGYSSWGSKRLRYD